jgi:citrate synthase
MADRALDTHKLVKRLTDSGLSEQAAEVLAEALLYRSEDVATRQDLDSTRQELKADIAALRTELKGDMDALRAELKGDMDALRTELKGDIAALRNELKADIQNVKVQILAIMLPAIAVIQTLILLAFELLAG